MTYRSNRVRHCLIAFFSALGAFGPTSSAFSQQTKAPLLIEPASSELIEQMDLPLFDRPSVSRSAMLQLNVDVLRERFVNPAADLPPDASVALQLFEDDDTPFEFVPDNVEERGARIIINGHSITDRDDRVILIVNGESVRGSILNEGTKLEIEPFGPSLILLEIDQKGFVPEADPTAPESLEPTKDQGAVQDQPWPPVIDIMVVYTQLASSEDASIEDTIILAEIETNDSYKNSGIGARVRIVHTEEVDYEEASDIFGSRNELQDPNDGILDHVHDLRDLHRADVVGLVVGNAVSHCGVAYIMENPDVNFAPFGFFVVRRSCATGYYSFGHELGHLLSARHDKFVDATEDTPFSFNHGHLAPSCEVRTAMGYQHGCSAEGADCTRKPFYSNPNVEYAGCTLGAEDSNNALTINSTAPIVATFR